MCARNAFLRCSDGLYSTRASRRQKGCFCRKWKNQLRWLSSQPSITCLSFSSGGRLRVCAWQDNSPANEDTSPLHPLIAMRFANCYRLPSASQIFLLHDLLEKADMRLGSKPAVLLDWLSQPHGVNSYNRQSYLIFPLIAVKLKLQVPDKHTGTWRTSPLRVCSPKFFILYLVFCTSSHLVKDGAIYKYGLTCTVALIVSLYSAIFVLQNWQSFFLLCVCHSSTQNIFWSKELALVVTIPLVYSVGFACSTH